MKLTETALLIYKHNGCVFISVFDRQLYKRGSMPRAHFHASVQNNDVSDFRRRVHADVSTYMGLSVDRTVGGFERLVGSSYDNAVSFIVDKVLFLFSGHLVKFESALLMVLKKCSVNEFDLGHGSIDALLSRPNIAHAININGRAFSSQLKAAVPRSCSRNDPEDEASVVKRTAPELSSSSQKRPRVQLDPSLPLTPEWTDVEEIRPGYWSGKIYYKGKCVASQGDTALDAAINLNLNLFKSGVPILSRPNIKRLCSHGVKVSATSLSTDFEVFFI